MGRGQASWLWQPGLAVGSGSKMNLKTGDGLACTPSFSLLTPEEERDLDLLHEERVTKEHDMAFTSFPIPDRQVPDSETKLAKVLERVDKELASGKNVVLHCRQGIGRSGLVAACLLVTKGLDAGAAIKRLSTARGTPVPETAEQRRWIGHYASTFANLK